MDLMKKLNLFSFERIGGSKQENECAHLIKKEVENLGGSAELESFKIDDYQIQEVILKINNNQETIEATGFGFSGVTDDEGLSGEFLYVESGSDLNLINARDKIVLINGRLTISVYKNLIKYKVKGFITFSGSFYRDLDLNQCYLRESHLKYGKIPGVNISINDAEKLIISNPKEVTIILKQSESEAISYNVISTIKGRSEEVIVFSAHYDSVKFSKGVYDNATGAVALLALYQKYIKTTPSKTIKFIWTGCEELGLLGAKAYSSKHQEELKNYLFNINIDMLAPVIGQDMAICTCDESFVTYLTYLSKVIGFPVNVSQGVYSSDSTVFADNKIPSLSYARNTGGGGAEIHTRFDDGSHLDEKNFTNSIEFIYHFSNQLIESKLFPIPKDIPQNMAEKIDKYFARDLKD